MAAATFKNATPGWIQPTKLTLEMYAEFLSRQWNVDHPILVCKFCRRKTKEHGATGVTGLTWAKHILELSAAPAWQLPATMERAGITAVVHATIILWRPICLMVLSRHAPNTTAPLQDLQRYLVNQIHHLEHLKNMTL